LSLYISGDIATLAAERVITAEREDDMVRMAGGFTAVLKKDKGKWVFIQTHFPQLSERPLTGNMSGDSQFSMRAATGSKR